MNERQLTRALLAEPWPGDHLSGGDPSAAFDHFLQVDTPPELRLDHGLQGVLRSIFPIRDFNETTELQFVEYRVTPPKGSPEDARRRGETHAGDLHLTLRIVVFDIDDPMKPFHERTRLIRDVKEQELFFCEIPWRTPEATFVVNGIDRVILRQLAEGPGVRFLPGPRDHLRATLTPHRGARLAFEVDAKMRLLFRINANKKRLFATTLLRALGLSTEEILAALCPVETFFLEPDRRLSQRLDEDFLLGQRATQDIRVGEEVVVRKHRKILRSSIRRLQALGVDRFPVDAESLIGRPLARDVIDGRSGEVLREVNEPLGFRDVERFRAAGVKEFSLVLADRLRGSALLVDTLRADPVTSQDEALGAIYSALRPGDAPTIETARYLFEHLFFSEERYDLSAAGRRSLNRKLHGNHPDAPQSSVLTREDLLATIRELVRRDLHWLPADDLGRVDEAVLHDLNALLTDTFYFGLVRIERAVKERLSMAMEPETLMPVDVVSGRPMRHVLDEFFSWSRVSERVDFTNPAAELAQRRKVSTSEPDRSSYKRSSYRARLPHDSHLGVFCPAEHPRGGLALALACRIDEAGALLPPPGPQLPPDHPDWRPPHPWELLGPGAALVPFLHHDAAEIGARCVANIHDALPSLHPEAPRVATGLEAEIAHASGLAIHAPEAGLVRSATAREILLETSSGLRTFPLRSFDFAPRGAHVRQRPAVRAGQRVEPGELLAMGPGVVSGELAVGHNLLVALVSGVTLGSSLMISERVVQRGQFTSLRLREYRLFLSSGTHEESFCAGIPGLDEDDRAHLDERGLARIGARVRGGDVLIGRTRQALSFAEDEAPPPEDTSLRLPAGHEGVVIGARILRRREAVMPRKAQALARVLVAELCPLEAGDLLGSRHGDRGTVARLVPVEDMPLLPDGTPVDLLLNPASVLESGAAGLLMETLAGALGVPVVAPPFAPITERQLRARGGEDGRVQLRDGATGEPFADPVTVGSLYMMKLPPLVREVQEVRSTGPTDPLTALPVEGQGIAPGQLLDEDAVAALMAHGAAFTLREMMTGKGDAPEGREALLRMIRDHEEPTDHVTRGLDALIRELRAAALEIEAGEES